jgi:hypothetical protein
VEEFKWDPEEALVILVVYPLIYTPAFLAMLRFARDSALRTWIKVQLLIWIPLTSATALSLVAGRLAR